MSQPSEHDMDGVELCEKCGARITEDNPMHDKDNLSCLDCYTGAIDMAHDQAKEDESPDLEGYREGLTGNSPYQS